MSAAGPGRGPFGDLLDAGLEDTDAVYEAFSGWLADQGLVAYSHQDESILELLSGANVVLATPTGSGKSLVATALHLATVAAGGRTFYTAPIKALVSEKFFALVDLFGAERVGMLTGDASVNPEAPIICCTAEILANLALRQGPDADVASVVMDEFHYYGDPSRGWAWQVPILELTRAQFLLMSATLGDTSRLRADLTRRTGRPTVLVDDAVRPVPLSYEWVTTAAHETIADIVAEHRAPVYVVHATQKEALERAQSLLSADLGNRSQRDEIADVVARFRFSAGFGRTLSKLVRRGIGVHHAGMLPRYRRLVERLSQAGLLSVICGTDTLGVGINVPIRTVLFTTLARYDGRRVRIVSARDFHQIAGRAGRAGFDTLGYVEVQAPEHVIANEKALAKAGDDPKARRKVIRKQPPAGTASYTRETFDRLVASPPEPLKSRMQVTYGMVLDVVARPGNPVETLRHLLLDNHEDAASQRRLVRRALAIGRSLLRAGIVVPLPEPDATGRTHRLTVDLQHDFALNQPLSAFALAVVDVLDPDSPSYALDLVSVIEATLEDPLPVLLAQQFEARGEAVRQMKDEGIEYDERMELLEDVTWPTPLAELLEQTLTTYRQTHPWLPDSVRPKSVVRDLYERGLTFTEYVAHYRLARVEGVLLRYLSDAYRALRRTVPAASRDEMFSDLVEWLGELVRQTDSSLVAEWESLLAGLAPGEVAEVSERPITANTRAFRVLVRNAMYRRVELVARDDVDGLVEAEELAAAATDPPQTVVMDRAAWDDALDAYYAEHDTVQLGPDSRGPGLLVVSELAGRRWEVRQVIDDPAGNHDWSILAEVDLGASDETGDLVLRTLAMERLD
ncbi:MAG: DEAD/DEAH box helicase [Propionibacteriaceae bacterium]